MRLAAALAIFLCGGIASLLTLWHIVGLQSFLDIFRRNLIKSGETKCPLCGGWMTPRPASICPPVHTDGPDPAATAVPPQRTWFEHDDRLFMVNDTAMSELGFSEVGLQYPWLKGHLALAFLRVGESLATGPELVIMRVR